MTKEQKLEAYSMRLDGASLQEIAEHFGVTRQWIAQILPGGKGKTRTYNPICVFPNIKEYLYKNRLSYSAFAASCGVSYGSIYRALTGKAEITKSTIDRILEITSMSYEEAFMKEPTDE